MFQNYLRLLLAFIFFINIFTPSLLQAQSAKKPKIDPSLMTKNPQKKLYPSTEWEIYEEEEKILDDVEKDPLNPFLVLKALEVLEERDRTQFSRDTEGRPLTSVELRERAIHEDMKRMYNVPTTQELHAMATANKPLPKSPIEEMFISGALHIGWIQYFLDPTPSKLYRLLLENPHHRKYFFPTDAAIPEVARPWFKDFWQKVEAGKKPFFMPREIFILEKLRKESSEKKDIAEVATYFSFLLDPEELANLSAEDKNIIREEYSIVEDLLKARLKDITGQGSLSISARGSIRLALWELYKFYYLTSLKPTSGMKASFKEITEGMHLLPKSMLKGSPGITGVFPEEYYNDLVFPLAAKGSFGDELCQDALNDVKKTAEEAWPSNQYYVALEYATTLLMQAKGNILPLMNYVDQNKSSTDLTSSVVSESNYVLQIAATYAYQNPFKAALFISTLRILSNPSYFSMRTNLPALDYAFMLYKSLYLPNQFPMPLFQNPASDGIKEQLKREQIYFAGSIGVLYCYMLYNYDDKDSFQLDSSNFASTVGNLSSMYVNMRQDMMGSSLVYATGSNPFPNMHPRYKSCKFNSHIEILNLKEGRERAMEFLSYGVELATWVYGGWIIGALFKVPAFVVKSSWTLLKTTPTAIKAMNSVRKGRKMTAAVIEYKKAYRFQNYVRNAIKSGPIQQTYTRGATTAVQGAAKATDGASKATSAAGKTAQQGAKAAEGATTAAEEVVEEGAKGITKQVTKNRHLRYSEMNLFQEPKQLVSMTRSVSVPHGGQGSILSLTDESIALFNAEGGIRNYDVLRKMRGVDQFGNTTRFFQPLSNARQWALYNPIIAEQELKATVKAIENGALKGLNLLGITTDGGVVFLYPRIPAAGNPGISRLFLASDDLAFLAFDDIASFTKHALSPTAPTKGILAELTPNLMSPTQKAMAIGTAPLFTPESVAKDLLARGYRVYGNSGMDYFTKVWLPSSWKALPWWEWQIGKASFPRAFRFMNRMHIGNQLLKPYVEGQQQQALDDMDQEAKAPYDDVFSEAEKWGKAVEDASGLKPEPLPEELQYDKMLSAQRPHLVDDLRDNNRESHYYFPAIFNTVGMGLEHVDFWRDIPVVGDLTDWVGESCLSLSQGMIENVPGGGYIALPIMFTGMGLKGGEGFKRMGGTAFSQKDKDALAAQYGYRALSERIAINKIKANYRKSADALYNIQLEGFQSGNISADKKPYFEPLLEKYHQDLLISAQKPETANDSVKITEQLGRNFQMTDLKINLEQYKQIVQKDYTPEQAKPILAIVDKTIQEIDALMKNPDSMTPEEQEAALKAWNEDYLRAVLIRYRILIEELKNKIKATFPPEHLSVLSGMAEKDLQEVNALIENPSSKTAEELSAAMDDWNTLWIRIVVMDYKLHFKNMKNQLLTNYHPLAIQESIAELDEAMQEMDAFIKNPNSMTEEEQTASFSKWQEIYNAYQWIMNPQTVAVEKEEAANSDKGDDVEYYKEQIEALQSKAKNLPTKKKQKEVSKQINAVLAQIEELLQSPENITDQILADLSDSYHSLETFVNESMKVTDEDNIVQWEEKTREAFNQRRSQENTKISTWSNKTSLAKAAKVLATAKKEIFGIIAGKGTIQEKEAQIAEAYRKMELGMQEAAALETPADELLPDSETDLNTQAY